MEKIPVEQKGPPAGSKNVNKYFLNRVGLRLSPSASTPCKRLPGRANQLRSPIDYFFANHHFLKLKCRWWHSPVAPGTR